MKHQPSIKKRSNTPEGILKKASKRNFEHVTLILPETSPSSEKLLFHVAIKGLPVEVVWEVKKSLIKQYGLSGVEFFLVGINSAVNKYVNHKIVSEHVRRVSISGIDFNCRMATARKELLYKLDEQLQCLIGQKELFEYTSSNAVLRGSDSSLEIILQSPHSNGSYQRVASGVISLSEVLTRQIFDKVCEEIELISSDERDAARELVAMRESVKLQGFCDLEKMSVGAWIEQEIAKECSMTKKAKNKEKIYNSMISEQPFHELYQRNQDRQITILCAPTNSGKTYHGTNIIKEALKDSETGHCQMLFPLRVLALQIQQDMEDDGVPCSMITGEEQEVREYSRLDAMTVEIFDTDKQYDTVFLDEGQLAFSDERSGGYLRVICGANCKHLVIACAPSSLEQMKWYLGDILNVEFTVQHLDRLTPLESIANEVSIDEIRKGDLLVAFSRKSIHKLAARLNDAGLNVGTLYGALSPAARKAMLVQYRNHGYDVLVASDAIGMGVSAPAQRVIFAETEKFDGKGTRELSEEEYRQIAGRAGRFGYAEYGQCGVLSGNKPERLVEIIGSNPTTLPIPKTLFVTPDKTQLYAAEGLGLAQALIVWKKAIRKNRLYAVSNDGYDELMLKAEWLDKQVNDKIITFGEAVKLLFVTFPMRGRSSKFQLYKEWVSRAARNKILSPPRINVKDELKRLEEVSHEITLMIQLSRIFPSSFVCSEQLNSQQSKLGCFIAKELERKYTHK